VAGYSGLFLLTTDGGVASTQQESGTPNAHLQTDVSRFSPGVYFVKYIGKECVGAGRFIKQLTSLSG
jgi:hypothetical protein